MNREDIIRMAREVGIDIDAWEPLYEGDSAGFRVCECTHEELERFAALVASAERNRTWTQDHWTEYERSLVAQEREACAKVCDDLWEDDGTAYDCAEAIRTLGQA